MKKEKHSKPHFAKVVDYAPNEPWRTDFIFGQKGKGSHAHLVASGAIIHYLRDEQGKEIIVGGNIIKDKKENENRR